MGKKSKFLQQYKQKLEKTVADFTLRADAAYDRQDVFESVSLLQRVKDDMEAEQAKLIQEAETAARRKGSSGWILGYGLGFLGVAGYTLGTILTGGALPALTSPLMLGGAFGGGITGSLIGKNKGKKRLKQQQEELAALAVQFAELKNTVDGHIVEKMDIIAANPEMLTSPAMKSLLVENNRLAEHFFNACQRKAKAQPKDPGSDPKKGFNL